MRFLTADRIHDGKGWLPEGSVLEVSDEGVIISIQDHPHPDAVFYEGVLAPCFVNAHCHLELSHMKGVVKEHTGLMPFLMHIPQHRNDFTEEQKRIARHAAYDELLRNGVAAVGDISNTTDTIDLRGRDEMHVHTFVETLGFNDAHAPGNFSYALNAFNTFAAQNSHGKILRQSIVPHAPYSVSSSLFRLIDAQENGVLMSIHNQESDDEGDYYKTKQGGVRDLLNLFGIDDSSFIPSGKSSLQTYLDWMSPHHSFIFVHNTCSKRDDVQYAHERLKNAYWCLCPNANLYIENRLPDIDMLISEHAKICIGTDSLASNNGLSILSELVTINERYPKISWETLLTWATCNGAAALEMGEVVGCIEPGKNPGIVQLTGLEDQTVKPYVKRIL